MPRQQLRWEVLFLIVVVLEILIHGNYAFHFTDNSGCKDVYIWIADGSLDCKYLSTPSVYGVHKRPEYYCTTYSQTDCCETCTRLGFTKGGTKATTPSLGITTAGQKRTTTLSPKTRTSIVTTGSTKDTYGCKDVYIWIADGSLNCKYLSTPSSYGVHKRPEYYCNKYSLTDCCETCTRLGFTKGDNKATTTPSVAITTVSQTTSTTRSTTENPNCRDFGVWIMWGLAPCRYLQKESYWGIHNRPEYYCNTYRLTWCCQTCATISK